jgi:Fic family protein
MRRLDVHLGISALAWPALTWDSARLASLFGQVSREQGRLLGRMQDLGFELRREAQLSTLTEDVVRSSESEGEKLDIDQVRSSIARRLGMEVGGPVAADRDVEGVVEMMLDATMWFVTIHPFDDGNGRIARAIADMALAQRVWGT